MRRVSKPWLPTNVRCDGQEPCSMAKAEQEYIAGLQEVPDKTDFARSHFDLLDKAKLREVMYREQRSICIYCERTIKEGYPPPRIEHWRPLSINHTQALHWKNLYLSCPFHGTCDDAKGQRTLKWDDTDPDLPWPIDFDYEKVLGFTSNGEIYVRNDANIDNISRKALKFAIGDSINNERKDQSILNLNHPSLVAARRAELDKEKYQLERDYKGRTASRADREKRAHELEVMKPLPQFISIRVAWLKKLIGKGR